MQRFYGTTLNIHTVLAVLGLQLLILMLTACQLEVEEPDAGQQPSEIEKTLIATIASTHYSDSELSQKEIIATVSKEAENFVTIRSNLAPDAKTWSRTEALAHLAKLATTPTPTPTSRQNSFNIFLDAYGDFIESFHNCFPYTTEKYWDNDLQASIDDPGVIAEHDGYFYSANQVQYLHDMDLFAEMQSVMKTYQTTRYGTPEPPQIRPDTLLDISDRLRLSQNRVDQCWSS